MAAFELKPLPEQLESSMVAAIMGTKFPYGDAFAPKRMQAERDLYDHVREAITLQMGSGWPITIQRLSYGNRPLGSTGAFTAGCFINVLFERGGHPHFAWCHV